MPLVKSHISEILQLLQKIAEDMERQRGDVMQRLEARRRRQMDRNFEAEAAVHMLKEAESQSQAALDRTAAERGNQKSLVNCL